MKLIFQIPCFNEEKTLPLVLQALPKSLKGIGKIEILVINDGSSDKTAEVAKQHGVTHIIHNRRNFGLAHTFRNGMQKCLIEDADIMVNLDGDNQYNLENIEQLIEPILANRADIVIGCRDIENIHHFSKTKKFLQRFGSWVVRKLSKSDVADVTSGYRVFGRQAMQKLTVLSNYTYTLETILQTRSKGLVIENIPVKTNPKLRESRLMKNTTTYIFFSIATIVRVFTMYNPLKLFLSLGGLSFLFGILLVGRFFYFYFTSGGNGHVQSLIIAAITITVGVSIALIGLIADSIQFNRRLLEDILERLKRLESKSSQK